MRAINSLPIQNLTTLQRPPSGHVEGFFVAFWSSLSLSQPHAISILSSTRFRGLSLRAGCS